MSSLPAKYRSEAKMIYLTKGIMDEIRTQANEEIPNEACGYLIGGKGVAHALLRMTNADNSPEHFSFSPEEQFAALGKARELEQELIAVYHTHPVTPPRMSDEDIRLANDPGIVYLIYAVATDEIKAFKISEDKVVTEISIEVMLNTDNVI